MLSAGHATRETQKIDCNFKKAVKWDENKRPGGSPAGRSCSSQGMRS